MSERMLFLSMIKKLVSALEGAPFPTNINRELYRIWYEHSREVADEAMKLLAEHDVLHGGEEVDLP